MSLGLKIPSTASSQEISHKYDFHFQVTRTTSALVSEEQFAKIMCLNCNYIYREILRYKRRWRHPKTTDVRAVYTEHTNGGSQQIIPHESSIGDSLFEDKVRLMVSKYLY